MSGPFSTIALAISAIMGFSLVWTIGDIVTPEQSFMSVRSIVVEGEQVRAIREIREPGRNAEWRVIIFEVGSEFISCATTEEDGDVGLSFYEAGYYEREMHLDQWVGDKGCYDRLAPGKYGMSVVWTPLDSSPPVKAYTEFEKLGEAS